MKKTKKTKRELQLKMRSNLEIYRLKVGLNQIEFLQPIVKLLIKK